MSNSLDDSRQTASLISKAHGGTNVTYCYNSTKARGLGDIVDAFWEMVYVKTDSVKMVIDAFNQAHKEMNNQGILHLTLSSEAGLIFRAAIKDLDPELLARTELYTFGSAYLFPDDGKTFRKVENYLSWEDGIGLLINFLDYRAAILWGRADVHFLEPVEPGSGYLENHSMCGATYSKAIGDIGSDFLLEHPSVKRESTYR